MTPTDAQITAAARALSNDNADVCNVNREDNWNLYGDSFRETARVALEAALGVEAGALNGVPATDRHGEGAIARCHYCGRYSLDPKTLSDRQPKCECGEKHGWCGSFKKPGPDAKWSGTAPPSPKLSTDTVDKAVHKLTTELVCEIGARHSTALRGNAGSWDFAFPGYMDLYGFALDLIETVGPDSATASDKEQQ